MSVTLRVHWLTVTIWANEGYGLKMWEEWFEQYLGRMNHSGHGGRGFRSLHTALLEAKLYATPIFQENLDNEEYFSFEFPGDACDAIPDKTIQEFIVTLNRWEKAKFTRVDLAWDGVGFVPENVKQAVDSEQVRSYARRSSMKFTISPYEEREDGELGTSSLRLGSNQSTRLLRVYDKHGPVRVELQARKERADLVAREVLALLPPDWFDPAIGHLRDYIDFLNPETKVLLPWWEEFINGQDRAMKTVSDAKQLELTRMVSWLITQVAPTMSVAVDIIGSQLIEAMLVQGRRKRGSKFDSLLEMGKHDNAHLIGGANSVYNGENTPAP